MTKIIYDRPKHSVRVEGHSGYAAEGQDIVCSAVSILVFTLAASVANMEACKQIRSADIKLDPADAVVACKCHKKTADAVTLIFDTLCGGFELLAAQYPDFVEYEIRI